ncbi:hypothetical protein N7528_006624 [Penicillium herquei]|nr:hypothetical protein N7528_006624 [Penicillium herquei]
MTNSAAQASLNSSGKGLVILTVIEGSVALFLIIARVYTTWRITRHIRSDLYLSLLTFIIASLGSIFLGVGINTGLGAHKVDLTPDEVKHAIKWNWINQSLGIIATAIGKLAIVAFLQQIHGPESRKRVIFLWGVGLATLLLNCITIALIWTQCSPRAKLWDDSLPGNCDGRARNMRVAYFQGSFSALCDLVLALYPITFFWHVQLDRKVKIGLCILMGLGVVACVCAIVKTTFLNVLDNTDDTTYYMAQLIILNETEKWVVFIVGCVPPIRPLLLIVFRRLLSSARSVSGHTRTHYHGRSTELHSYPQSQKRPQMEHFTPNMGSILQGKDSEENILAEEGGIVKTTEVRLSYENGSSTEGASSMHQEHAPPDNAHFPDERV